MEITEYGKDRLPSGPAIDDSEEIILVEGRADVLNLLKNGFKNVIAMNGTSVPQTIIDLAQQKVITVFVDGDRGGNLILRELSAVAEIDFVTKAPDGKEVEEITKKEINKALRSRIAWEQAKLELKPMENAPRPNFRRPMPAPAPQMQQPRPMMRREFTQRPAATKPQMSEDEKKAFRTISEELIGTRGAFILGEGMSLLGKVPVSELETTIKSLKTGVHAIILDGEISRNLVIAAEKANVKYIIGAETKVKETETRITLLTVSEL
jgi:DNA primase